MIVANVVAAEAAAEQMMMMAMAWTRGVFCCFGRSRFSPEIRAIAIFCFPVLTD